MDIAELFRATKGDRSYDDLERACGGEPSSQRLQQIATTKPKEFPRQETIRALSRGLGVSERAVIMAYAESLGFDTEGTSSRLAELLPAAAAQLSDEQTAAVLAVVRAMAPRVAVVTDVEPLEPRGR